MNNEHHQHNLQVIQQGPRHQELELYNPHDSGTMVSAHNLSDVPAASISIVFLLAMSVGKIVPNHAEVLMECVTNLATCSTLVGRQ